MNKTKLPKEFKLHLISRLVSYSGDNISSIATMLYVLSYSNSYFIAGLNLAVSFVPQILFSTLAGKMADEKNNKKIMTICDLINSVFAFALAFVVLQRMSMYYVFAITFVMNTCDTFHSMSSGSFVKDIIKDDKLYHPANSISTTTQKTLGIVFNLVGALMCEVIGYALVFIINGVSFILSAFIRQFIKYIYEKKESANHKKKLTKEILETLKLVVTEHKATFMMFIVQGAILNIILAPLSIYMPAFVKDTLSLTDRWYGIFITMIPIGNILYSANSKHFLKLISSEKSVILAYYLQGVSFLVWALGNSFISGAISMLILGFSLAMTGINLSTLMQISIPDEIYGKVSGIGSMVLNIAVPVGYLVGGVIMNVVTLRMIFFVSGLVILVATFVTSSRKIKVNKMS